jgi:hypothetical protein
MFRACETGGTGEKRATGESGGKSVSGRDRVHTSRKSRFSRVSRVIYRLPFAGGLGKMGAV